MTGEDCIDCTFWLFVLLLGDNILQLYCYMYMYINLFQVLIVEIVSWNATYIGEFVSHYLTTNICGQVGSRLLDKICLEQTMGLRDRLIVLCKWRIHRFVEISIDRAARTMDGNDLWLHNRSVSATTMNPSFVRNNRSNAQSHRSCPRYARILSPCTCKSASSRMASGFQKPQ